MPKIKLADYKSYSEGAPKINAPSVYGASAKKPFLYKIPATGKRCIYFSVSPSLPNGLTIDRETGIISGVVDKEGKYSVTIHAENTLGKTSKELLIDISKDNICRTPLMGWTSWNAFGNKVSQAAALNIAKILIESGLADYGYQYVNVDSGWQGEYGGKYDAIMPNDKFPDMKTMCDIIHSYGLKAGIYSTPMQKAWGGGEYPGCTAAPVDPAYPNTYYGIGSVRKEQNNVRQWEEFGIDYLKYDWSPCDVANASIMRKCLSESSRDFAFSITVRAGIENAEYWKNNCSSWRDNPDSIDSFDVVTEFLDADKWSRHCRPGHFFDLDMLEIGYIWNHYCKLTEDEQLLAYSARAIFPSPLQISCDLTKLTQFDMSMLCNEEIIAINQDSLGIGAVCIADEKAYNEHYDVQKHIKVYKKPLEDASTVSPATSTSPLGQASRQRPYGVHSGCAHGL